MTDACCRAPAPSVTRGPFACSMDHAFVVCDPSMDECPIVFASNAFLRMVGLTRELILGRHPSLILVRPPAGSGVFLSPLSDADAWPSQGPEHESPEARQLKELLKSQDETSMPLNAFHSNGDNFHAQINLFPMKDGFMVAVLINISQVR